MYYELNRGLNLKGTIEGQTTSRPAGRGFRTTETAVAGIKGRRLAIIIDGKLGRQVDRNGRVVEADQTRYTLKETAQRSYEIEWVAEAQDVHPDERPLATYEEHVERVARFAQLLDQAEYRLSRVAATDPQHELLERRRNHALSTYVTAAAAAHDFYTAQGVIASTFRNDLHVRMGLS